MVTDETLATLSLNSLVSITSVNTMKLAGRIGQQPGIDKGAIHSVISTNMVKAANIPITATSCYDVLLRTGGKVRTDEICKSMQLDLGYVRVVTDFIQLELSELDVILGIKWLETLENMQVNWQTMIMKFEVGGSWILLQGDPSLCKSQISLKAMIYMVQQKGEGFWVELGAFIVEGATESPIPPTVATILDKHLAILCGLQSS